MKSSRDRWSFAKHPAKPRLSEGEVRYLKSQLSKILKIGQEYEFNLPEKKNGNCKGDSNSCPCSHMSESDCWSVCIHTAKCEILNKMSVCEKITDTCEEEDCKNCEHFVGACKNIFCPNFVSTCMLCENFEMNCKDCEFKYDPSKNPEHIRRKIIEKLNPNKSYGTINKSGVFDVTTDGSLLGMKGAEVITIGRRIDYWEFYNMAKEIIDTALANGAYVNERCSLHMHVLAAYYAKTGGEKMGVPPKVNEMERPMPEIVLSNFHQLCRRYQNALVWMTMGLEEQNRMTRWEKFRVSILPISAVFNTMPQVQQEVSSHAGGNKYGFVNYNNTAFDKNGDVSRLHLEMRGADCLLTPSGTAAIACMYYALMIKAVEISRYGVLEIGDESWLAQATEIKEVMMNNMKDYGAGDRFSDTSKLYKYYDILRRESMELVRQLKHILFKIGPAYEVLEKLAEAPCALRRIEGHTWEDIEKDLSVIVTEEDKLHVLLKEFIDLRLITECNGGLEEWITVVTENLGTEDRIDYEGTPQDLRMQIGDYIEGKMADGEIIWSNTLGAPIQI